MPPGASLVLPCALRSRAASARCFRPRCGPPSRLLLCSLLMPLPVPCQLAGLRKRLQHRNRVHGPHEHPHLAQQPRGKAAQHGAGQGQGHHRKRAGGQGAGGDVAPPPTLPQPGQSQTRCFSPCTFRMCFRRLSTCLSTCGACVHRVGAGRRRGRGGGGQQNTWPAPAPTQRPPIHPRTPSSRPAHQRGAGRGARTPPTLPHSGQRTPSPTAS